MDENSSRDHLNMLQIQQFASAAFIVSIATVIIYLIAGAILTGYITQFTGGLTGISFSALGFSLTDVITFLPIAMLTLYVIATTLFRPIRFLIYFLLIGVLGSLIVGSFWQNQAPQASSGMVVFLAIMMTIVLPLLITYLLTKDWLESAKLKIAISLSMLAEFSIVVYVAAIGETNNVVSVSEQIAPFYERPLLVLGSLVLAVSIPLSLFQFGRKMAELTIKNEQLSLVRTLALKASYNVENANTFLKDNDQVFNSTSENPMYLVAAFKDAFLFYLPTWMNEGEKGGVLLMPQAQIHHLQIAESPKSVFSVVP